MNITSLRTPSTNSANSSNRCDMGNTAATIRQIEIMRLLDESPRCNFDEIDDDEFRRKAKHGRGLLTAEIKRMMGRGLIEKVVCYCNTEAGQKILDSAKTCETLTK